MISLLLFEDRGDSLAGEVFDAGQRSVLDDLRNNRLVREVQEERG